MEPLFLGIDGGATGCRARIEDTAGRRLGEGQGGPANPRFGVEAAAGAILAATHQALGAAGLGEADLGRLRAGLGLAGVGQAKDRAEMLAWRHPFAHVALETDAHVACLGAHGGRDGGIVVVGTGSCGVALVGGRVCQVGGWGFPISDLHSGAWLGLEAVRHALLAHDGVVARGGLADLVLDRFAGSPENAVAWMDAATSRDYAALAPIVLDRAAVGDDAAVALMRQAGHHLAMTIETLAAAGAGRISLLGGLAAPLTPWLPPAAAARTVPPLGDALDGALLLARSGADPAEIDVLPGTDPRAARLQDE